MSSDYLFIVASAMFFIWTMRSLFYWVAVWQRASYQLNRLLIIKRARKYLLEYLISIPSILTWLSLAAAIYFTISDRPLEWYQWLVLGLFFTKTLYVLRDISSQSFYRPHISLRSVLIIVVSLTVQVLLYSFPLTEKYFWLLLLDRALFLIVTFFIISFSFPSEIYEDILKMRAQERLRRKKIIHSIIVGPGDDAGNYAYIIRQVLQKKFQSLLITYESPTPSDIAQKIIREFREQTDILITALDNVNMNSLQEIGKLLHPTIGVAIASSQIQFPEDKVKLFLELLPQKGKLLLDSRLEPILHSLENKHKKYFIYSTDGGRPYQSNETKVRNSMMRKTYSTFEVQLPTRTVAVKTSLISNYYIKLLIPAITLADRVGFTQKQIGEALENVSPVPHIMNYHKQPNSVVLIDNTANNAYETFEYLMQYLSLYRKQKFLILGTSDLITSDKQAKVVGSLIAKHVTHVLLLHDTFGKSVRRGIRIGTGAVKVVSGDEKDLLQYLEKEVGGGDCVAFEAQSTRRMFQSIIKKLSQNEKTV